MIFFIKDWIQFKKTIDYLMNSIFINIEYIITTKKILLKNLLTNYLCICQ